MKQASAQPAPVHGQGGLATPAVIDTGNQQLREELARAMADGGAVGDAASILVARYLVSREGARPQPAHTFPQAWP